MHLVEVALLPGRSGGIDLFCFLYESCATNRRLLEVFFCLLLSSHKWEFV